MPPSIIAEPQSWEGRSGSAGASGMKAGRAAAFTGREGTF